MKPMFGSSLFPVVCRKAHVLFTLFVFATYRGVQHILYCAFIFPRLLYHMWPVSLNCPFLMALPLFSNVYLILTRRITTHCFLSVTHREVILWQQIQTRVIAWWSEYKFWCDQGNLDFFWQSFRGKLSLDVFIYGNNTVRLWINTHHIPRNLDNL
jgi:hypothetical protein